MFVYGFRRLFDVMVSAVAKECLLMVSVVCCCYGFRRGKERFLVVFVVGFDFVVSSCYRSAAVSPMEKRKQDKRKTPGRFQDELSMHIYIYIYIYMHTQTYTYIHTHTYIHEYIHT